MNFIKNFYSRFIFARIIEKTMTRPSLLKIRAESLIHAQGEILEIGFGTGINLECYPKHVTKISVVDIDRNLLSVAQKRIENSEIAVDFTTASAEKLPFDDTTFDCVVSTFAFCSIPNVSNALKEMHRVLKPGGKLIFLEHGLSPDKWVRIAQKIIAPIYGKLACNPAKDIQYILTLQPFKITTMEQFYYKDASKITGYFYKGIAEKLTL